MLAAYLTNSHTNAMLPVILCGKLGVILIIISALKALATLVYVVQTESRKYLDKTSQMQTYHM